MTTGQITIEELLERYESLSDELFDILENPSTAEIINSICIKNNITRPDWIETIKQLVGLVILGFIHYYDLGSEINLALRFSNSKLGNDIADEIYSKILAPYKQLLEKNYAPPKPKEEVDLFDQIINILKTVAPQKKESVPEQKIESVPTQLSSQPIPKTTEIPKTETTKESPAPKFIFNINQEYKKEPTPSNGQRLSTIPQPPQFKSTSPQPIDFPKIKETQIPKPSISEIPQKPVGVSPSESKAGSPPTPFFIHTESIPTPIQKGIEISLPQIKISEIKKAPPPPKPAEIEVGVKKEKSNIRVVNFSSLSEPEIIKEVKKTNPPPPPPSPPPPPKQN